MATPRIFHLMQRAHASLYRAADRLLDEEFGIGATQLGLLFVLSRTDGQTATAAAKELAVAPSSLTGLAQRMVARGLIRRESNAEDARSHRLWLEPLGRDIAAAAGARVAVINRRLLAAYSAEERALIARFLDDIALNAPALISGKTERKSA